MSRSGPPQDLSTSRKRRGVARASVTRMDTRVAKLERKEQSSPGDLDTARRLLLKLEELDSDFKSYHLTVVDLTEEESLDTEQQAVLDDHDDKITNLSTCLQQVISNLSLTPNSELDSSRVVTKRLGRLEKRSWMQYQR